MALPSMRNSRAVFNPEMLVLARESEALTQSALGSITGVSQGRISKIEAGLLAPDDALIGSLARALRHPREFFFLRERIRGLPVWFYRKRKKVTPRFSTSVEAKLNVALIWLTRLLAEAELEPALELPRVDLELIGGTPEAVAQHVRAAWHIPRGPLRDLTRVVEEAGCIVIPFDFGSPDIDGVGLSFPAAPVTFFVNGSKPTDRQRYTLAHELGHIVMHSGPRQFMEAEADRFASELLMPSADIAPFLGDLTLDKLATLKPVWRVSMAALLRRAKDLGKVTERQYTYLWTQMGQCGFRKSEPRELDLLPESPTALNDLLEIHFLELHMSFEQIATHLCAHPDRLAEVLLQNPTRLRLVPTQTVRSATV